MRIELEYLANVLGVFFKADTAHINLTDINESGVTVDGGKSFDEKFIFHIQIAIDNQLIGIKNGPANNLEDIGVFESMDGCGSIVDKPIRLTQVGHDFALSLDNKEVLSKLKRELKDAPFKAIFEGGQKLLQHYAKKKLDELIK